MNKIKLKLVLQQANTSWHQTGRLARAFESSSVEPHHRVCVWNFPGQILKISTTSALAGFHVFKSFTLVKLKFGDVVFSGWSNAGRKKQTQPTNDAGLESSPAIFDSGKPLGDEPIKCVCMYWWEASTLTTDPTLLHDNNQLVPYHTIFQ